MKAQSHVVLVQNTTRLNFAASQLQIVIDTEGQFYFAFSFCDKCRDQNPLGEKSVSHASHLKNFYVFPEEQ